MSSPELFRRIDQGGQEIEPTLKTKVIFAGQGRKIGPVCDQIITLREHPIVRIKFDQADEILQDLYPQEFREGITPIILNGSEIERRRNQQAIIFLNDVSCLDVFRKQYPDINIVGFAGYSFGTVTAAYASGAIKDEENALRFVVERMRIVAETNQENPGKLKAFAVNHADPRLKEIQEKFVTETSIRTSNRFTVIGGPIESVDLASQEAENREIKTYPIDDNDAAYHTSLLNNAVPYLREVLTTIEMQNPHSIITTNSAKRISKAGQVQKELATHIATTSDWQLTAHSIITKRDTEQLIEIGNPTGILSGHLQRDLEDQDPTIKKGDLKKNLIKVGTGTTALGIGTFLAIRAFRDNRRRALNMLS